MGRPRGKRWCAIRKVVESGKTVAWRLDYYGSDRKRHRGFFDKRRQAEREIERLRDKGLLAVSDSGTVPIVEAFMPVFLAEKADEVAAGTLKQTTLDTYGCNARRVVGCFGSLRLDQLGYGHLVEYRRAALAEGLSEQTVDRHFAVLSAMLTCAIQRDLIVKHVLKTSRLKRPRREKKGRALTELEQARLETAARELKPRFPWLYVAVLLPLHTGIRPGKEPGATLALRWDEVEWAQDQIFLPRTKGRKALSLKLTDRLREELRAWRTLCSDEVHVFPGSRPGTHRKDIRRAWAEVVKASELVEDKDAGLRRLRYYDLRHTAATTLLRRGMPIHDVRDYLGHSSIVTTAGYAHPSRATAEAAAAILGGVASGRTDAADAAAEFDGSKTAAGHDAELQSG